MEGLFIDPSSLPGGRSWAAGCHEAAEAAAAGAEDGLAEVLHCDVTPFRGFFQVFLLLLVYGGVLYNASQLIAHGSELLLLVPSLRGIVGTVVLPILGAVPDGAIVLFSALGENAQEELSVGVGALAGSTSMLLTLPWFLSIMAGRVNIRSDGVLTYHNRHKLNPPGNFDLDRTGVQPQPMVQISARIMLFTAISYVVIQGAAIASGTFFKADQTVASTTAAAKLEQWPAIFCFVVCTAFFIWYLYDQVTGVSDDEKEYRETFIDEVKQKAIRNGEISLTAAFQEIWETAASVDESSCLINSPQRQRLGHLLSTFFRGYDHDGNHRIDRLELQNLMRDLGERISAEEIVDLYTHLDKNGDGHIELDEFVDYMPSFIIKRAKARVEATNQISEVDEAGGGDTEDTNQEEEEEVPDELRHDDPKVQIRNVIKRAFSMMAFGTFLVLIFSDPMVAVLSEIGQRIGVPAFYVSFLLAPLASNASELLAAYSYAMKKTRKTITISFSTLLGAAIMNNTFVLAIFMFLLATKGLAWTFTAETISILVVELFMGYMSMKKVMTLRDGFYVLAMFPTALIIVAVLENVFGLD